MFREFSGGKERKRKEKGSDDLLLSGTRNEKGRGSSYLICSFVVSGKKKKKRKVGRSEFDPGRPQKGRKGKKKNRGKSALSVTLPSPIP